MTKKQVMLDKVCAGSFILENEFVTHDLMTAFGIFLQSELFNDAEKLFRRVGFIGSHDTGKSTCIAAIIDTFGDVEVYRTDHGVVSERKQQKQHTLFCSNVGWVNHYDSRLTTYHLFNIAAGHFWDEHGVGIDFSEHADHDPDENFDYIFEIDFDSKECREIKIYVAESIANNPEFQAFINRFKSQDGFWSAITNQAISFYEKFL